MRTTILLLTLAIAPVLLAQERLVVKMEPVEGLGPFHFTWSGTGEAGDPIGGPFDPLEDSVTALPAGLHNPDVRFLDLQTEEAYRMGYLKGNVKKAMFDQSRRYYGATRAPDSVFFDQRLDYAVGRDDAGNYAVVFDTDNDEDLSDETVHSLPWNGPPMSIKDFADSVMNTPRYDELAAKMPPVKIETEAFVDGKVVRYKRSVVIMPFLYVPSPAPTIPDKRLYLIGYGEHRRGQVVVDGTRYDIWTYAHEALYRPETALFRVTKAGSTAPPNGLVNALDERNQGLGDVVELGDRKYRFDKVDALGDRVELVDVSSRSLIGAGSPAPSITGVLISGDAFNLADLKGKYVLLKFWSTDCVGCYSDRTSELLSTLDRSCIDVVGVSGNDMEKIRDWTQARGISWGQISDAGGRIGASYGISAYPTNVLVNPVGEVVSTLERSVGPDDDSDMLARVLPAACYNSPTADDVTSVFWGDHRYTDPTDYFVEGCSFDADEMTVQSVGDRDPDRGWPVTMDVSGECTPHENSDRQDPWHQDLTLNVWMFQNMGQWALLAREPFVVSH